MNDVETMDRLAYRIHIGDLGTVDVITQTGEPLRPRIDRLWVRSAPGLMQVGVSHGMAAVCPVAPCIPDGAGVVADFMVPAGMAETSECRRLERA